MPEEEFIDRRIEVSELIEIETDSDEEIDTRYVDSYNNKGSYIYIYIIGEITH